MKQLPAALGEATTAEKLAYLWVYLNPGEHSARRLSAVLGVDVRTALSDLTRKGLLMEEIPPSGPKPGQYRAVPQRSGRLKSRKAHDRMTDQERTAAAPEDAEVSGVPSPTLTMN